MVKALILSKMLGLLSFLNYGEIQREQDVGPSDEKLQIARARLSFRCFLAVERLLWLRFLGLRL